MGEYGETVTLMPHGLASRAQTVHPQDKPDEGQTPAAVQEDGSTAASRWVFS